MPPTVENVAAPAAAPAASVSAKDALTAVSTAASSAASSPEAIAAQVVGGTGDTAKLAGSEQPGSTAPATSEPSSQGPSPAVQGDTRTAEAPEPRIQSAVRNARTDTVRSVFRSLGMDAPPPEAYRETVGQLKGDLALVARMRQDPRKFYADLGAELGTGQLASEPAADGNDREPEPNLVSEDGKLKTFDHQRLGEFIKFHLNKAMASLRGEFAPVAEGFKEQQATTQRQAIIQKNTEFAGRVVAHARKNLPHFTEHEAEIKQRLGKMDPAYVKEVGEVAALYAAHAAVVRDVVLPGYGAKAEQKVRDENAKKAATSNGSVRPGGQVADGKAPVIRNSSDLAAHMRAKAEKMGIPS